MNPKTTETSKKVAIIGSGPSGLTAAIYTARANLDTTIFLGMQPGGQLTTTTEIENFPSAWDPETKVGMMGPDLMTRIQEQAEHFGAKAISQEVQSLQVNQNQSSEENESGKPAKPSFVLTTSDGQNQTFDAVIIASGASARWLNLPGEDRFIGKGYHSCATCDGFFYRGKTIAVVGGGDSAMEEANFLTKFAEKVYLIHRSDRFRASKIMLERAKNNPKIEFLTYRQITELVGGEYLEKVILENTENGEKEEMVLDAVFVAIGHIPNTSFVQNLLTMDEAGYLIPRSKQLSKIMTEEADSEYTKQALQYSYMSDIAGIFIAGDVEDTVYRQAITAAGDGCRAAIDCEKWLDM